MQHKSLEIKPKSLRFDVILSSFSSGYDKTSYNVYAPFPPVLVVLIMYEQDFDFTSRDVLVLKGCCTKLDSSK